MHSRENVEKFLLRKSLSSLHDQGLSEVVKDHPNCLFYRTIWKSLLTGSMVNSQSVSGSQFYQMVSYTKLLRRS